jgi:hypothetical protein
MRWGRGEQFSRPGSIWPIPQPPPIENALFGLSLLTSDVGECCIEISMSVTAALLHGEDDGLKGWELGAALESCFCMVI